MKDVYEKINKWAEEHPKTYWWIIGYVSGAIIGFLA